MKEKKAVNILKNHNALQHVNTKWLRRPPAAPFLILDYKNETTFSGNVALLSSAGFHEFSRCLKKESRISC